MTAEPAGGRYPHWCRVARVAGLVALHIRPRRPLLVASLCLGVWAAPVLSLAAGAPLAVIAILAVASGGGNGLFDVLWETALLQHVPAAALSRVSAYDWFGSLAFQPIGLAIALLVGTTSTLWIAGLGMLVECALLLAVPDIRRLERPRQV